MPGFYKKIVRPINFFGDIVIINVVFLVCAYFFLNHFRDYFTLHYSNFQVLANSSWIISILILKPYKLYRVQTIISIINSTLRILALYIIIIEAADGLVTTIYHSGTFVYYFYGFSCFFILFWRILTSVFLRMYRKKGHNFRRVVVLGVNKAAKEMVDFFRNQPEHGYRLYKEFDINVYEGDFDKYFAELKNYCLENRIDEIYCSMSELSTIQVERVIEFTDKDVLRLKFIPDSAGYNLENLKIDFYGYLPVYIFRPIPLDNQFNKMVKRIFDLIFSLCMFLFVFSWIFPIIAIIIKWNSKGPVFFKQRRSGLENDNFGCYKFRSMYSDENKDGIQATKGDLRVTTVGAFLRKTSLDELPQFLNVILGQMSIVGPRPHPLWLNDQYRDNIEKYMLRHFIKPGITGLAQVKGFRGETTDPVMMERRIKMDVFYLENWSFLLDIKIIFMTIFGFLKGDKNAF
jgi:putative colanic acid biosysnthesis UDP-glucose lipid carrier transferase